MSHIPPLRSTLGARVVDPGELERAATALVHFGIAPDGLPWLLDVDRSQRLNRLYNAVLSSFGLGTLDDLPDHLRRAVQDDVASGLMGVHRVTLEPGDSGDDAAEQAVYVSRKTALEVFGPSLLVQILEPETLHRARHEAEQIPVTSAAMIDVENVERAIVESQSYRHLVLTLRGQSWIGTVGPKDRALRTPSGAFRKTVFESLGALSGTRARVWNQSESWEASLSDSSAYLGVLARAGDSRQGGWMNYLVPRAAVLGVLRGVAEIAGERHQRGVVHADIKPGNILIDAGKAVSCDAIDVDIGAVASAGTFEWAAPEQIIAQPLDPRADVFSIGKMLCKLLGGVPYGKRIEYVVPTGGTSSKTVQMLETDGVFVDILETDYTREWQNRWQDLLSRCLAYDREKRPADGKALASELSELAHRFPVQGHIEVDDHFGAIVPMDRPNTWAFARMARDS